MVGDYRVKGVGFFFLSGNHIQNCRSTEKIGRKEIILRFFFSLGIWHEKKNREVNIRDFFPNRFGFFPTLGLRRSLVDGFFFCQKPREKKKNRKIIRQRGRKEVICDYRKIKKPTPFGIVDSKKHRFFLSVFGLSQIFDFISYY